jgi:hypothetical protein
VERPVATSSEPVTQSARRPADRLLTKLQAAWQDLSSCSDAIARASIAAQQASGQTRCLRAVRDWYAETTRGLLAEPLGQFRQFQPIRDALEAMRTCDQEITADAIRSRNGIDRRFQRLLILVALDLCEPWRIWRGGNHPTEWSAWDKRRETHNKEGSVILDRYARWTKNAATADVKDGKKLLHAESDVWWQQHRALLATMQFELDLRELTLTWFAAAEEFVYDVCREREALQSFKEATCIWLEEGARTDKARSEDSFALITPEERLRSWTAPVEALAKVRLPERVELLSVLQRPRLRSMAVCSSFLRAFDTYGRMPVQAVIEDAWHQSARIVREVEQAKEMISYWSEASSARPDEASAILAEARHNALAALAEQTQIVSQPEELEAAAVDAFWKWQQKSSVILEAEQYGWISLLQRPRARKLVGTMIEIGQGKGQSALQQAGRWTSARVEGTMESIAGRVPAHPSLPPVVRRMTLRDTLALPASKSELPALYRMLFRLAPVEDRRFLVGRDQEMAGLDQAVKDWVAGRFAACLLIGARGSGKTSLLNCATNDALRNYQWIRAEFHERLLTPTQLEAFLRQLLNLGEDADFEAVFRMERRVLILEEAERIYLRKVDGFAAAHHLLHLIHRTASTTLWIIVMNDKSYRVLDAGTHLHRVFSHRINAMNVSRVNLENAILERHRLSGLRLEFAPPPAGDPRISRAKRWIGLEESPQKLFFDSLFQQSEGIFRSAFDLWLSSIERVEGDTILIRQPLDPSFNRFRSELAQEDQFTLLVVQEHGSLTQEELAEVLCEPPDTSRGRTERLSALGLIEPDPYHPGLRIRPEAQRFVNDLLRRANLT